MIVHLMLNEKFTEPTIQFISDHFEAAQHQFIIIGEGIGANITKRPNVLETPRLFHDIRQLTRALYRADKIIIHGLFHRRLVPYLAAQPWLLKKCNWVVWGGDLYWYQTRERTWSNDLYEWVRRALISRLGEITTLVPGDFQLAQKWYKTKAIYRAGRYVSSIKRKDLDKLLTFPAIEKDALYIQIGNSADRSNQHQQVLDSLLKFKDENIRIFVPLSYGDTKYGAAIAAYGKTLFGDKFVPLLDFVPPDEYSRFLQTIDIAIFNHDRQQALGNICVLLYLGKKVFIRDDITSWDYLKNDLGIDIYATDAIGDLDFAAFSQFTHKEKNRLSVSEIFDYQKTKSLWNVMFNGAEDRG